MAGNSEVCFPSHFPSVYAIHSVVVQHCSNIYSCHRCLSFTHILANTKLEWSWKFPSVSPSYQLISQCIISFFFRVLFQLEIRCVFIFNSSGVPTTNNAILLANLLGQCFQHSSSSYLSAFCLEIPLGLNTIMNNTL